MSYKGVFADLSTSRVVVQMQFQPIQNQNVHFCLVKRFQAELEFTASVCMS